MATELKNAKQYTEAQSRIEKLKAKRHKKGSDKARELDNLLMAVKNYDDNSIANLKPIGAIKLRAKQLGLTDSQLTKIFGYRSRKSEIFSGSRKLSLEMIRRIHKKMGIPAEVLIRQY